MSNKPTVNCRCGGNLSFHDSSMPQYQPSVYRCEECGKEYDKGARDNYKSLALEQSVKELEAENNRLKIENETSGMFVQGAVQEVKMLDAEIAIYKAAIEEALVNALMHRDYFFKGANISLFIYDDSVDIISPGGLPRGLDKKDFGKLSVRRNQII